MLHYFAEPFCKRVYERNLSSEHANAGPRNLCVDSFLNLFVSEFTNQICLRDMQMRDLELCGDSFVNLFVNEFTNQICLCKAGA